MNKNQHATSSMSKTDFTRRKINVQVQVSQREASTCNMFYEEEIKIFELFRRHKSRYIKFPEEIIHMQHFSRTKNKHATCFTKKKWICYKFQINQQKTSFMRKKSTYIMFHFHLISMQQVSWTKNKMQYVLQRKILRQNKLHERKNQPATSFPTKNYRYSEFCDKNN